MSFSLFLFRLDRITVAAPHKDGAPEIMMAWAQFVDLLPSDRRVALNVVVADVAVDCDGHNLASCFAGFGFSMTISGCFSASLMRRTAMSK